MSKNDALLDAVQDYFWEIGSGSYSTRKAQMIDQKMYEAAVELRPEIADGPPPDEKPAVAAPVPEEANE